MAVTDGSVAHDVLTLLMVVTLSALVVYLAAIGPVEVYIFDAVTSR